MARRSASRPASRPAFPVDSVLNWTLLALNIGAVLAVVWWRARRAGGIAVGHVELFSFGFLYYWMLPAAVALAPPLLGDDLAVGSWYALAHAVPAGTMGAFLALGLGFYAAFVGGSAAAARVASPAALAERVLPFDARLLNAALVPCAAAAVLSGYQLRGAFFSTYDAIFDQRAAARGPFLALSVFVLSLAVLYTRAGAGAAHAAGSLRNRWVLFYLLVGVAVIALGGRMYFITGLLVLAVYRSVFGRPFGVATAAALGAAGALFAAFVGVARFGLSGSAFGVAAIVGNFALEPVFTSFSLFDFLRAGRLELVNVPYSLATGFLNFVPTYLLPNKVDYMVGPEDLGYSVRSPLGALNSFVSLMVNFGALGSAVVLAAFGAALERLRRRGTAFAVVAYSLISGFCAFSLFRDPFYTSVVKSVVQLSLVTPALVVAALHVLTVVGTVPRAAVPAPAAAGNGT
jgi:hypothetical protein